MHTTLYNMTDVRREYDKTYTCASEYVGHHIWVWTITRIGSQNMISYLDIRCLSVLVSEYDIIM